MAEITTLRASCQTIARHASCIPESRSRQTLRALALPRPCPKAVQNPLRRRDSPILPELGHRLANVGDIRPISAKLRLLGPSIDPIWPNSDQHQPNMYPLSCSIACSQAEAMMNRLSAQTSKLHLAWIFLNSKWPPAQASSEGHRALLPTTRQSCHFRAPGSLQRLAASLSATVANLLAPRRCMAGCACARTPSRARCLPHGSVWLSTF